MDILKELHASVAEACEASFDTAYRKLESKLARQEAGLKEGNRNASIANEARQATEDHVNKLEQEILALKEALKIYESSPESAKLTGPFTNLKEDFAPENVWREGLRDVNNLQQILEDKYSSLYNNLQTVIAGWWGLKTKVLQHKKKLRHWEKQLEREEFSLVLNGALVTFRRAHAVPAGSKKPMFCSLDGTSEQAPSPESESAETSHLTPESFRVLQDGGSSTPKPRIKTEPTSQQLVHGHPLQSNSHSPLGHHSPRLEPSSDTVPPLPDLQTRKRKRVQQSSHAHPIEGDRDPQRLVSVKNEPMSSSPLQSPVHSLGPPLLSTQDLDDIGDTVQTPTKRHGPGRHRDDPITESSSSHVIAQRNTPDRLAQNDSVLQPVNANTHALKSTDMAQRSNHRAALIMAEDGDHEHNDGQPSGRTSENTPIPHKALAQPGKSDTKSTRNRLQGLLDGATPSRSPFSASRKEGAIRPPDRGPVEPSRARNPLQPDENAPEVRPEDEPYRFWPLHQLSIDQFKINTARNQGFDFAYDSVTRKKDERKCLSGCTRPGCCGDRFRAMARLGGPAANNSTAEQMEEDRRILEEYVGDDREKLKQLSAHDRENLLVDARARVLANQYGRHRHSYQRAQSPPGFWRTDMPSTQEMESDREAAHRQEREKVEERYREAMRPGGLWKFADE